MEPKAHCEVCDEYVELLNLLDHFRLFHPEIYESFKDPDGELVFVIEG